MYALHWYARGRLHSVIAPNRESCMAMMALTEACCHQFKVVDIRSGFTIPANDMGHNLGAGYRFWISQDDRFGGGKVTNMG